MLGKRKNTRAFRHPQISIPSSILAWQPRNPDAVYSFNVLDNELSDV